MSDLDRLVKDFLGNFGDDPRQWEGKVHEFAMRLSRAAEVHYRTTAHGYDRQTCEREAIKRYPLPPKQVLREEPVPGTDRPVYRWRSEVLEVQTFSGGWTRESLYPAESTLPLMRHAIDLSQSPYREEPQ